MANTTFIIALIQPLRTASGEYNLLYCTPSPEISSTSYVAQMFGLTSADTIQIGNIGAAVLSIRKSNIAWIISDSDPDDANMASILSVYFANADVMGMLDLT